MKVLLTGGAGFIGSNICDLLLENGHEVVVVDNLYTGRRENVNPDATFYEVDICDKEKLSKISEREKPTHVCHQAAQANVRKSIEDPEFDRKVNVEGSVNVFELSAQHGVEKIVYASSGGAIYGDPQYLPADEGHPIQPLSPYAASKFEAEKKLAGVGVVNLSLRYSNVYGPRQDPYGEAGVVAIFTQKFLAGEVPEIFGDGGQTRDFVYVKDVAEANLMALEKSISVPAVNIATGTGLSVNQLALKLGEITGSSVEPVHVGAVEGEVRKTYLDITLAEKELGWKPKTSLENGLAETVGWVRQSV